MDARCKRGWPILVGYLCLALAIPVLTPSVPDDDFRVTPIAPVLVSDTAADEAMMEPLREQANAALRALQTGSQTASAN